MIVMVGSAVGSPWFVSRWGYQLRYLQVRARVFGCYQLVVVSMSVALATVSVVAVVSYLPWLNWVQARLRHRHIPTTFQQSASQSDEAV